MFKDLVAQLGVCKACKLGAVCTDINFFYHIRTRSLWENECPLPFNTASTVS